MSLTSKPAVRTPKQIEYALDDIATRFVECHDYLDLSVFDSKVQELTIAIVQAETLQEDDTCKDCGELSNECICEEDEDEVDSE